MDFNKIFGALLIILGFVTIFGYITKNKKMFWKKQKMQDFWGKKLGFVIHFGSYAIAPIIVGVTMFLR